MSPIGAFHGGVIAYLNHFFTHAVGTCAVVDVQNPVILDNRSEPQPDLMLLRPRDDFYRSARPQPPDVLLLIEVAIRRWISTWTTKSRSIRGTASRNTG